VYVRLNFMLSMDDSRALGVILSIAIMQRRRLR
jgi:hypothetical protein